MSTDNPIMTFREAIQDICERYNCGPHTWGCRCCPFDNTVGNLAEAERRATEIFKTARALQHALSKLRKRMKEGEITGGKISP